MTGQKPCLNFWPEPRIDKGKNQNRFIPIICRIQLSHLAGPGGLPFRWDPEKGVSWINLGPNDTNYTEEIDSLVTVESSIAVRRSIVSRTSKTEKEQNFQYFVGNKKSSEAKISKREFKTLLDLDSFSSYDNSFPLPQPVTSTPNEQVSTRDPKAPKVIVSIPLRRIFLFLKAIQTEEPHVCRCTCKKQINTVKQENSVTKKVKPLQLGELIREKMPLLDRRLFWRKASSNENILDTQLTLVSDITKEKQFPSFRSSTDILISPPEFSFKYKTEITKQIEMLSSNSNDISNLSDREIKDLSEGNLSLELSESRQTPISNLSFSQIRSSDSNESSEKNMDNSTDSNKEKNNLNQNYKYNSDEELSQTSLKNNHLTEPSSSDEADINKNLSKRCRPFLKYQRPFDVSSEISLNLVDAFDNSIRFIVNKSIHATNSNSDGNLSPPNQKKAINKIQNMCEKSETTSEIFSNNCLQRNESLISPSKLKKCKSNYSNSSGKRNEILNDTEKLESTNKQATLKEENSSNDNRVVVENTCSDNVSEKKHNHNLRSRKKNSSGTNIGKNPKRTLRKRRKVKKMCLKELSSSSGDEVSVIRIEKLQETNPENIQPKGKIIETRTKLNRQTTSENLKKVYDLSHKRKWHVKDVYTDTSLCSEEENLQEVLVQDSKMNKSEMGEERNTIQEINLKENKFNLGNKFGLDLNLRVNSDKPFVEKENKMNLSENFYLKTENNNVNRLQKRTLGKDELLPFVSNSLKGNLTKKFQFSGNMLSANLMKNQWSLYKTNSENDDNLSNASESEMLDKLIKSIELDLSSNDVEFQSFRQNSAGQNQPDGKDLREQPENDVVEFQSSTDNFFETVLDNMSYPSLEKIINGTKQINFSDNKLIQEENNFVEKLIENILNEEDNQKLTEQLLNNSIKNQLKNILIEDDSNKFLNSSEIEINQEIDNNHIRNISINKSSDKKIFTNDHLSPLKNETIPEYKTNKETNVNKDKINHPKKWHPLDELTEPSTSSSEEEILTYLPGNLKVISSPKAHHSKNEMFEECRKENLTNTPVSNKKPNISTLNTTSELSNTTNLSDSVASSLKESLYSDCNKRKNQCPVFSLNSHNLSNSQLDHKNLFKLEEEEPLAITSSINFRDEIEQNISSGLVKQNSDYHNLQNQVNKYRVPEEKEIPLFSSIPSLQQNFFNRETMKFNLKPHQFSKFSSNKNVSQIPTVFLDRTNTHLKTQPRLIFSHNSRGMNQSENENFFHTSGLDFRQNNQFLFTNSCNTNQFVTWKPNKHNQFLTEPNIYNQLLTDSNQPLPIFSSDSHISNSFSDLLKSSFVEQNNSISSPQNLSFSDRPVQNSPINLTVKNRHHNYNETDCYNTSYPKTKELKRTDNFPSAYTTETNRIPQHQNFPVRFHTKNSSAPPFVNRPNSKRPYPFVPLQPKEPALKRFHTLPSQKPFMKQNNQSVSVDDFKQYNSNVSMNNMNLFEKFAFLDNCLEKYENAIKRKIEHMADFKLQVDKVKHKYRQML